MKGSLYVLTIFLGVVLTVHLAMNGKVGAAIGNPRIGNMVFWCIGAIGAILIGLTGWQSGALAGVRWAEGIVVREPVVRASLMKGA